jgi:hypothetical protein
VVQQRVDHGGYVSVGRVVAEKKFRTLDGQGPARKRPNHWCFASTGWSIKKKGKGWRILKLAKTQRYISIAQSFRPNSA